MSPAVKQAPGENIVETALHDAKVLEYERAALLDRIGANRDLCRLLDRNSMLDEEQGAWLDSFYPPKEKGQSRSPDDVKGTREAKIAARREIAAERGEATPEASAEEGDE